MEPVPKTMLGVRGWLALAAIGGVILWLLIAHPVATLSCLAGLVAVTVLQEYKRSQHVHLLTQQRANEDIGTFARAFDRRGRGMVDPWAIRAVWNALVPLTESNGRRIPLRPTDSIEVDLRIDPDDVPFMTPGLVEQCERVPGDWNANPYQAGPGTVGNLVHFISAQPLRRPAPARLLPNER